MSARPVDLPKPPSFRLDGRRALVTGAGRGIGLAAAAALADAGAHVTLAARTGEEVAQAAAAIRARGQAAAALTLDVTDLAAVTAAIAAADPFDVLVNNAGTNRPAPFTEVKPEDFDAVFAINARPQAWSGLKPSCARMAPVIATGVPKPAIPSINAPNENAIKSA